MALTPRCRIPYPEDNADPWYESFESMLNAMDAALYAAREDRNTVLTSAASFSFDAGTGVLAWDNPISIFSPVSGYYWVLAAGDVTLNSGESFYITATRNPQSTVAYEIHTGSVLPSDVRGDDQLLIGVRVDDRVYFRNGTFLADGEARSIFNPIPASLDASVLTGIVGTENGGLGQDASVSSGYVKFTTGVSSFVSSFPIDDVSGLGTGVGTFLVTPSSANLRAAITDETGSGALVFATSPTLVTPTIGVATGTSLALGPAASTAGALGFENNASIFWKNAANNADLQILNVSAANNIVIGQTTGVGNFILNLPSAQNVQFAPGGTAKLTISSVITSTPNPIDFSAGATAAGTILRIPLATSRAIVAGTQTLLASASGEGYLFTDSGYGTQCTNGRIYASSSILLGIGSATFLSILNSTQTIRSVVPMTIEKGNIAATSTDGLALLNTNASTAGVTAQYSTRVRQLGHAWNSTSGLDETHEWMREVRPVTNAGATTSSLVFARSLNGGAYSDVFTLLSSGHLRIGNAKNFYFRRADDLGDLIVFSTDTSNNLSIGSQGGPNMNIQTSATLSFFRGGSIVMDYDGTKIRHIIPVWMATNATPANPSAGSVVIWFDGTNLKAKDSAGNPVTWA